VDKQFDDPARVARGFPEMAADSQEIPGYRGPTSRFGERCRRCRLASWPTPRESVSDDVLSSLKWIHPSSVLDALMTQSQFATVAVSTCYARSGRRHA
jgi:hypothetical protein